TSGRPSLACFPDSLRHSGRREHCFLVLRVLRSRAIPRRSVGRDTPRENHRDGGEFGPVTALAQNGRGRDGRSTIAVAVDGFTCNNNQGVIPALSWSFGVSNPTQASTGLGTVSGKGHLTDVSVSRRGRQLLAPAVRRFGDRQDLQVGYDHPTRHAEGRHLHGHPAGWDHLELSTRRRPF